MNADYICENIVYNLSTVLILVFMWILTFHFLVLCLFFDVENSTALRHIRSNFMLQ